MKRRKLLSATAGALGFTAAGCTTREECKQDRYTLGNDDTIYLYDQEDDPEDWQYALMERQLHGDTRGYLDVYTPDDDDPHHVRFREHGSYDVEDLSFTVDNVYDELSHNKLTLSFDRDWCIADPLIN